MVLPNGGSRADPRATSSVRSLLRSSRHTCYHTVMQKTTVYLPEGLKRRLGEVAHRRGQPEAELIRQAIERLLAEEARPRPLLPLFHGDDPTLAERVDEALAGFGE